MQTTEEGARKRVDRALDKLRNLFAKRGVSVAPVGALSAILWANTASASAPPIAAHLASVALAAAKGVALASPVGLAGVLAKQAMNSLAVAKVGVVAVAGATAGAAVLAGAVVVNSLIGGGGNGASGVAQGTGTVTTTSSPSASSSRSTTAPFDTVARPFDPSAPVTPRSPTSAPTTAPTSELARRAVAAFDPSLARLPLQPGWPLALPGEVTTTATVADLDGDGSPEIVLPVRRRSAAQKLVHPEPNWATQLFAFTAGGKTVDGFPIELVEATPTPNPRGFWSSSPSVFYDAQRKANLVLTLPVSGGTAVVHPDRSFIRLSRGNPSMNVPLADLDGDGVPDVVGGGALANVLGGEIEGWSRGRLLNGYGTSIGDVDLDETPDVFRPSYSLGAEKTFAELGGFTHDGNRFGLWPDKIPLPDYFPPALGDVSGDRKLEVVGAYGTYVFVWTHDGTPAPGTSRVGEFAAVLKSNVTAWQATPALADLDGDGKAEIIVFDQTTKSLKAWHGDGRPVNADADGTIVTLPAECAGVSVIDLGGDGVWDFFTGTFWVKWRPGSSEPALVTNMLPEPAEVNFVQPTVADVDGDGKMEVVFGLRDGRLFVYRTELPCTAKDMQWPTANGSFAHTSVWPPQPPPMSKAVRRPN
jgi:hypothetical protein